MKMRPTGRKAALPTAGYEPASRVVGSNELIVRYVPEHPREVPREFDFSQWDISPQLRQAFASAFKERTRPGGPVRTNASAYKTFRNLRSFSEYLGSLDRLPKSPSQLSRAHLQGWYLARAAHAGIPVALGELKTTLRQVDGLSDEFHDAINEPNPRRRKQHLRSYSRDENRRILKAARSDVREAAMRIRKSVELLNKWRDGALIEESEEVQSLGKLLDFIDSHGDVPRYESEKVLPWVSALGPVGEQVTRLHLSGHDVAAFAVLLVGLTGQNPSTVANVTAAHHRPDGYSGSEPSAIVKLDKPRRGSRRYMDVPLTSVPPWARTGMPEDGDDSLSDKIDLQTPFGVFKLLLELTAPARKFAGHEGLFIWWTSCAGDGMGRGFKTKLNSGYIRSWSLSHAIAAENSTETLEVTLQRMRLTFNELQQRPVAHTETTLANEYLARNRGDLVEYQRIVADALTEQVDKASTRAKMQALSSDEVSEAQRHPERVAKRHGMDTATLRRLLAGELDTVLGACVGYEQGQESTEVVDSGPCRASFILCLGCPCARATPAHLPMQVAVYDEMLIRKGDVTPLRWAARFAEGHARLSDLLSRAGNVAVEDARAAITEADRELARHFLERDLDVA